MPESPSLIIRRHRRGGTARVAALVIAAAALPLAASADDPAVVAALPPDNAAPAVAPPSPIPAPPAPPTAALPAPPPAPPPPADEDRGLSLSVGTGGGYGTFGLQARYDLALTPWLRLAPLIAAGVITFDDDLHGIGAAGLALGAGYRHRFAVDATLGPTGVDRLDLHGTLVDARVVYGPIIAIGYEYMASDGSFQRFTIGHAFTPWRDSNGGGPSSSTTFTLAFGWRP